jgi:hypothetical protein
VSEADYLNTLPKIAIILKEVNDPGGGGWDLRVESFYPKVDDLRHGIM